MRTHLRRLLTALLTVSLATTIWTVWEVTRSPVAADAMQVTQEELVAVLDQLMAKYVSEATTEERLNELLSADQRNWVAIDGVLAVANEREFSLSPLLLAREQDLRSKDHSVVARAERCAACVWDVANCDLSAVMFCRISDLTPIGDVVGVVREGGRYAVGEEVDAVDLSLSAVGLAATAAAFVSGGSAYSVKLGASVAKTARRMGKLSNKLTASFTDVAKSIDWKRVGSVRSKDELLRALKTPRVAEASRTVGNVGSIYDQLGLARGLHVLQHIDSPSDARHLRRIADASGSEKTVGRLELLGKNRLLRASARLSDTAWLMVSAVFGLLTGLAGLFGSALFSSTIRLIRRLVGAQTA